MTTVAVQNIIFIVLILFCYCPLPLLIKFVIIVLLLDAKKFVYIAVHIRNSQHPCCIIKLLHNNYNYCKLVQPISASQ